MSEDSIQKTAFSIFGEDAFEGELFYRFPESLRFELSEEHGSYAELFHRAYTKADELLKAVFSEENQMQACIGFYSGKSLLSNLSVFKGLDDCEIEVLHDACEIWQKECPAEGDIRTFIAFPITHSDIPKLLWAAIASDLPVRPRLPIRPKPYSKVYIFSLELGILAHPYDDRGMDIIGPNKPLKQELYNNFSKYLLDYDLAVMKKNFG